MSRHEFQFSGETLIANQSGSLWWPDEKLLCVSNIHLAKSDHAHKKYHRLLPPHYTQESLARLGEDIDLFHPQIVICLGNSFDELKSLDSLHNVDHRRLSALTAGRNWVWIDGNSNAGPVELGGSHRRSFQHKHITFRNQTSKIAKNEISGFYNPLQIDKGKHAPCFVMDQNRIILPCFSQGETGQKANDATLGTIMQDNAIAVILGREMKQGFLK